MQHAIVAPASQMAVECSAPFFHHQIPIAVFYEYDRFAGAWARHLKGWVTTASLGLSKGNLGILFDPELRDAPQDREERLHHLGKLPPGLQSAILNSPYSKERVKGLSSNWKLYVSYCYSKKFQEAGLAAFCAKYRDKRITAVLPKFSPPEDLPPYAGIIEYDQESDTWKLLQDARTSPATVRVVCGRIPHKDLKHLMIAAEKETIVTGDGSLSEAISGRKHFFYEETLHKQTLSKALVSRYGTVALESHFKEYPMIEIAKAIRKHWDHPEMSAHYERTHEMVIRECDAWPRMISIINGLFSSSQLVPYPPLLELPCDPHTLPFDQVFRCTAPEWGQPPEDSIFETGHVQGGLYTLIRRRKTDLKKDEYPKEPSCYVM